MATAGRPGHVARLQAPNGQVCSVAPQTLAGTTPSPPKWPSTSSLGFGDDNAKYFTVSAQDGKSRYRVRAELSPAAAS